MKQLGVQYFTFLLFIIPLSFIAGIAVTEFFFFLCVMLFLIHNKEKYLFLDNKIIFLFLFSIFISISAYFKTSEEVRLGSIFYFRYILFSLSVIYLSKLLDDKEHKKYFYILIFFLLMLLLDSLYQFFYGFNILGYKLEGDRVSSFFNQELILGSYLVRLLPIILWFIFFFKINLKKNIFLIIIFLSLYFITILLSGERTSFFLWLVIMLMLFIFIKDLRKILSYSIIIVIFFIFFTSYLKLGNANTINRLFVKTYNQITHANKHNNNSGNIKNVSKKFNVYSKDHEGHILLALELFDKNRIFGIGPQGFKDYCRKIEYDPEIGTCSTHPHNTLIQIVTELGLLGLTFYIIAAIFVLYTFFKSVIKRKFNQNYLSFYSITVGLIINLFPFIPGGNFFNNWISIFIYFNIGLYIYSYNKCILRD
jgi:O-antigen ligase